MHHFVLHRVRGTFTCFELRRAFLDERRHAFLLIVRGEQRLEGAALEADALGERRLESAVHGFLAVITATSDI